MEREPWNLERPLPPPTRRTFALAALGLAAFVVYGSLVPFAFRHRSWDDATRSFGWAMVNRAVPQSRSDGLANLLLGVPLGFALLGAGCDERPGKRRMVLWAAVGLPACAGLAAAVEFGQVFLPTRTCAGSDVIAQTLGAAIGMVVWAARGPWLTEQMRVAWGRTEAAVPRPLIGYLAALAFVQALPLDLTAKPADLYRKFRDTVQYVPFGEELDGKRVGTLLQVLALYLPVGLLARWFRLRVEPLVLLVPLGMEAVQLVVMSRVPSATDVVVGAVGILAGWAARRPAWWLVVAWCGVLAVHAWQPWVLRPGAAFGWIPGLPLESGDPLFALEDFLTKLALFAPLGLFVPRRFAPLLGMGVAAVLEVGQMYVATRVPGVTDVLIGGLGAWLAAEIRMRVGASSTRSDG